MNRRLTNSTWGGLLGSCAAGAVFFATSFAGVPWHPVTFGLFVFTTVMLACDVVRALRGNMT